MSATQQMYVCNTLIFSLLVDLFKYLSFVVIPDSVLKVQSFYKNGTIILSNVGFSQYFMPCYFCSMTNYEITIGNDVARNFNWVMMLLWAHLMMLQCILMLLGPSFITTSNYDISVFFIVKSLKLYIKH